MRTPPLPPAQPHPSHYVYIGICSSCNSSAWLPLSALLVKRFWLSRPTSVCSTAVSETKRHLTPPNVMGRGRIVWSDFREASKTHSLCLSCPRNKTATPNISFSPLVFCTSLLFSLVSLCTFCLLLSARNWSIISTYDHLIKYFSFFSLENQPDFQ